MLTAIPQYIEIRKNRDGRDRAYLAGTRIKVQDLVVYQERLGMSVADLAASFPQLTRAQIHGALAYFHEDAEQIWRCIREDEESADRSLSELKEQGRVFDRDAFLGEISSRRECDGRNSNGPESTGN